MDTDTSNCINVETYTDIYSRSQHCFHSPSNDHRATCNVHDAYSGN